MNDWKIFNKDAPSELKELPCPPPWRDFRKSLEERRGDTFKITEKEELVVNLALYLRRPVLITGKPGCGKSSLAYAVAQKLSLGNVLHWPINSRTKIEDGLYVYDAIARLRDANLEKKPNENGSSPENSTSENIGRYIRLKQLGTALLDSTSKKPRVLLIDELDKSDIDFPNDLLHTFEDARFYIPELQRIAEINGEKRNIVKVKSSEENYRSFPIEQGKVKCKHFPLVFLTSNEEREFPPAFLRRCLQLKIEEPNQAELLDIISSHMPTLDDQNKRAKEICEEFVKLRSKKLLTTDQLLQAVYILTKVSSVPEEQQKGLKEILFQEIGLL